jgi:ankyrin repeat protein
MLKLYQEADARIRELGHDEETLVRRALGLVLSAGSRLLTSAELLSALRIDPEREDSQLRDLTEEWLLDSCPEILTLDWNAQVGPVWRFTHATCATFFESMKAEGHLNSARIYLKLLLANRPGHLAGSSLDDDPIFDPAHPLQVYARHHWVLPILMHQSSANSPDPMLCRLLQKFLGSPRSSSPAYQQWYKAVTADLHPPPSTAFPQSVLDFTGPETQSVFTVCRYSLFDLLEDWWTEPAVDLSIRNAKGQTPLEIVNIQHPESFAIGRRLVELGIDVNTTQVGRCTTALASAVSTGDAEWVQFLINHGASVDPDPGSALALAAEMDRLDLVRMLIQAGALVDADEDPLGCGSVLAVAAVSAGPEVVRELIDAGADVEKRLNSGRFGSTLAAAAAVGNLLCLYALLDAGADPNQELLVGDYGSALEAAACHGQLDCLLALLVAGADVNRLLFAGEYGCALAAAATGGYEACVDALLQNGADANLVLPDREQRLVGSILAASIPHKGCMRLLIDAGADINQPLPPGNHLFASGASRGKGGSPLAIAVEAGRVDCLEMLISAGADVNLLHVSEGLQCGSPLVAAAFAGSTGCLTALIKAGARVDQQTRVGIYGTALMAAAGQGQLECLRTLVAAGADVDKQVDGHPGPCQTALIAAAYMGRPECVEFLVEHGATVDQRLNGPFGNALQAALTDVSDQELARCGREREPGSLARLRPSARGGPPQSLSKGKARVVQLLKGYGAQVEESVP